MVAGEDGGLLVVLHQLVHGVEAALADAEHAVRLLHLKVLVLAGRLQRHREVARLRATKRRKADTRQKDQRAGGFSPAGGSVSSLVRTARLELTESSLFDSGLDFNVG